MKGEPAVLTLNPDGRGTLSRAGEEGELSWTRTGDILNLSVGGTVYTAAVEGECLLLEDGEGLVLRFEREETVPERPEPSPLSEQSWYGWWQIEASEGRLPETWYDCCAALEQDADGPVLLIWDEQSSREEPLARVWLELEERADGRSARSLRGWFLLQELGEGTWSFDPDAPQLVLTGQHDSGGERFAYRICLRPWGDRWETGAERLPLHLRDWYLPRIDAGEPLPDHMEY